MENKRAFTQTLLIFIGLVMAGASLFASSQVVPDAYGQNLMVAIGSAILGAGLTFFLLRVTALFGE
jgi:hypothetical protein